MKKVTVISSSYRMNGNSDLLAHKFAEGALSVGHKVGFVSLRSLNIKFCTGCLYCQSHDKCILNDSMNDIYEAIQNSDILVFASPVYYYSISGQLKTFLDRLNPLFTRDNKFKEVYILLTAADEEEKAMDGSVMAIQGFVDCFEGVEIKDIIKATGVTNVGDIKETDYLQKAFDLGKSV